MILITLCYIDRAVTLFREFLRIRYANTSLIYISFESFLSSTTYLSSFHKYIYSLVSSFLFISSYFISISYIYFRTDHPEPKYHEAVVFLQKILDGMFLFLSCLIFVVYLLLFVCLFVCMFVCLFVFLTLLYISCYLIYIKELGLPHKVYSRDPKHPILVATWEGQDPSLPSILLNGHTDVHSFPFSSPFPSLSPHSR